MAAQAETRLGHPQGQPLDAVVVGAGFAGLYMLHRLRGLGFSGACSRRGDGRRRHVVLEPLPGRALRRREPGVLVLVLRRAPAGLEVDRALRDRSPRSCAIANHVADRFDLRRDIRFDTRGDAAHFDDARATLAVRDRSRATRRGALLRHGDRLPLGGRACPTFRACESFAGAMLPHRRTGRTRASTSPASASA